MVARVSLDRVTAVGEREGGVMGEEGKGEG